MMPQTVINAQNQAGKLDDAQSSRPAASDDEKSGENEEPRRNQRGIGSEQTRFERDRRVGGGVERRYPPSGNDGYR